MVLLTQLTPIFNTGLGVSGWGDAIFFEGDLTSFFLVLTTTTTTHHHSPATGDSLTHCYQSSTASSNQPAASDQPETTSQQPVNIQPVNNTLSAVHAWSDSIQGKWSCVNMFYDRFPLFKALEGLKTESLKLVQGCKGG